MGERKILRYAAGRRADDYAGGVPRDRQKNQRGAWMARISWEYEAGIRERKYLSQGAEMKNDNPPKKTIGMGYVGRWKDGSLGWFMPRHFEGGIKKTPYKPYLQKDWCNNGEFAYLCKITIEPIINKRRRVRGHCGHEDHRKFWTGGY